MRKSVKVMAAAMAAMMALAGCWQQDRRDHCSRHKGSRNHSRSSTAETTSEAAGVELADGEYTVGIGQFAEHGSLDNCRTGFLQGLADEGIVEGKNLTVLYENAQADGGTASQIMNNFLSKKANLICAIATPIAQSAYSAAKDAGRTGDLHRQLPIRYWQSLLTRRNPVGEITGTSDKLPVESQLKMIRTMLPDAKDPSVSCTAPARSIPCPRSRNTRKQHRSMALKL